MTTISNRIYLTATSELLKFCEKNLVLRNPEYDNKKRLGLWTGNTPQYIYLYEIRGDVVAVPYGMLLKMRKFYEPKPVFEFPQLTTMDFRCDVPLYDYQQYAVEEMSKAPVGILKSRAGSGKTQMGIAMIGRRGVKTLWLTHTTDLLNQSYNRAKQYMDIADLGKIAAGKVQIGKVATFATIQTMCRQDLSALKNEWDMIIVDECHKVCVSATGYTMFSKVLNHLAARYKYGLSATPKRADGLIRATFAILGDVLYEVPDDVVQDRVLKPSVKVVDTDYDFSDECLNGDGTLNHNLILTEMIHDDARNQLIIDSIEEGKSSVILSDRIEHLEILKDMLPYPEKAILTGKMKSKDTNRQQILDDMRSGKLKYLFSTYPLFKEGVDVPCLERLYMATPQKDETTIVQSLGRIARVYEGKEETVCYDFVDKSGYFLRKFKQRSRIYRKEGINVE